MFDQWIVDSVHDYYSGQPIPGIVEKVLVEICAGRAEGMSISQIRKALDDCGVKLSKRDIRGVLMAHQQHTGQDLGVLPNTQ